MKWAWPTHEKRSIILIVWLSLLPVSLPKDFREIKPQREPPLSANTTPSLSTPPFPRLANIPNTLLSQKPKVPWFCIHCGYSTFSLLPYKVNIQEIYFDSRLFLSFPSSFDPLLPGYGTNSRWNHCFLPLPYAGFSGPLCPLAALSHWILWLCMSLAVSGGVANWPEGYFRNTGNVAVH